MSTNFLKKTIYNQKEAVITSGNENAAPHPKSSQISEPGTCSLVRRE